jgi:hypothetical protein
LVARLARLARLSGWAALALACATACGSSDSGSATPQDGGAAGDAASGGDGAGGGDAAIAAGASVLQMHNHINRDGMFVDGALTEAALMGATMHLDATFSGAVTGNVYASPLYVESGPGGKGAFYVVTESNDVYALDETSGAVVWGPKSMGPAPANSGCGCGNIHPLGITGTPAIDLGTRLIVLDAATANAAGTIATHVIHALSIDDGSEAWKLDVSTMSDKTVGAFDAPCENQRSAVLIVGGVAYVTFGGHSGDCGDYHGWIVGVPLAGPAGAKAYATPSSQSGMWAPGGPSSDGTDIYMATGNGDMPNNMWGGEFSLVRFHAGPVFSGDTADYWFDNTLGGDVDLGGTAPLVVDAPALNPSAVLVQLGKDGNAYLVDRANLGGASAHALAGEHFANGEIINVPAWATTPAGTFVAFLPNGNGAATACAKGAGNLAVIKIDPAAPNKMSSAWCANVNGRGSPSITTSDGSKDALLWAVGAEGSGQLYAWDLATGAPVVTGSDKMSNVRRFTTPIAVHGRIFIGADNKLYALKH